MWLGGNIYQPCIIDCTYIHVYTSYVPLHLPHSDEDTDIKALVTGWLKSLPNSDSSALEGWIDDYFYRALDWVMKNNDLVVDTTLVGMAMNGLSHLVGVASKAEFACALVRGLGGNLPLPTREKFAKEVRSSLSHLTLHSQRVRGKLG